MSLRKICISGLYRFNYSKINFKLIKNKFYSNKVEKILSTIKRSTMSGLSFFRLAAIVITFGLFCQSNILFGNSEKEILKADKKKNRPAPVLSNTAYVRLKAGYDTEKNRGIILSNSGIQIEHPLLKKSISFTHKYQKNQRLSISNAKLHKILKAEEPVLRTYRITYEGNESPEAFCRRLKKENPAVEIAEPVYLNEILYTPNDPWAGDQNQLKSIKAFEAWDIFKGDTSVVICISDNGCNQTHEDIINNIAPNWDEIESNNIDDDGNGYIDDFIGYNFSHPVDGTPWGNTYHSTEHGTPIAGIAGADFNNGKGMTGVAGKCRLFPLKTMNKNDTRYLSYSYESIIYAAVREFDVLNCSWGQAKVFSDLEKSIIDLAIAHDVAIVAASGNSGEDDVHYPAGYPGVLGVGEVTPSDQITSNSTMGEHVDVMAPGIYNTYTTNNNYYSSSGFSGTSAAAPVASGHVAMIRAKHPELDALQSLAFAKLCVDDISGKNSEWTTILPGRVNMLKAVQTDPFSLPGIGPLSYEFKNSDGIAVDRFDTGDTVTLSINVMNYLGAADDMQFHLVKAFGATSSISLIDKVVQIPEIKRESDFVIEEFKFVITQRTFGKVLFRLDIYNNLGEKIDFFLFPFTPGKEFAAFENERIKFSVGDRGTFGFAGDLDNNKQGVGFVLKDKRNDLWKSGLMATENNTLKVSSVFGDGPQDNDFRPVKRYIAPNEKTGIVNDSAAGLGNRIGLQIRQRYTVLKGDHSISKVDVYIKNISGIRLRDVAVGYYFDWDIGDDFEVDKTRLFPEGIPKRFEDSANAAIQLAENGEAPKRLYGSAVYSEHKDAIAQAAGARSSSNDYQFQLNALNSGTSLQFDAVDDIIYIAGMKFPGYLENGDSVHFAMYFGGADDENELASAFKNVLDPSGDLVTTVPEVKFAPLICEDSKDTTITIENSSLSNFTIDSIDIIGKDNTEFKILSEKPDPIKLFSGDNTELNIRFNPASAGNKEAKLYIEPSKGNTVEVELSGVKESVDFALSVYNLNFRSVAPNKQKDTTMKIENIGTYDLEWDFPIDIDEHFKIVDISPKTTEGNGGESIVKVRFLGDSDEGIYEAQHTFTDYCGNERMLTLKAEVDSGTGVNYISGNPGIKNINISPNPTKNEFNLEFIVDKTGNFTIDLFDLNGTKIRTLADKFLHNGYYRKEFNVDGISSGSYLIIIQSDRGSITSKLKIIH